MKYKYTGAVKQCGSSKLRQIVATKDFGNVKKGQLGGWIEKYSNLDQNELSWIHTDSHILGDSVVTDNSYVENSWINGSYISNTHVSNSTISKSEIGNDVSKTRLSIVGSTLFQNTIKHNISDTEQPIRITTMDFEINYSGFEIVGKKKDHYVSVGCQDHSVEEWLDPTTRTRIMRENGFQKNRETEFLHYLQAIIARHFGK